MFQNIYKNFTFPKIVNTIMVGGVTVYRDFAIPLINRRFPELFSDEPTIVGYKGRRVPGTGVIYNPQRPYSK